MILILRSMMPRSFFNDLLPFLTSYEWRNSKNPTSMIETGFFSGSHSSFSIFQQNAFLLDYHPPNKNNYKVLFFG